MVQPVIWLVLGIIAIVRLKIGALSSMPMYAHTPCRSWGTVLQVNGVEYLHRMAYTDENSMCYLHAPSKL